MKGQGFCGASARISNAARHPGNVPQILKKPLRIDWPGGASETIATAKPAQYGFIHPDCKEMLYTSTSDSAILTASLVLTEVTADSKAAHAV